MIETLFETKWLGVYRSGHWDFVRRPNSDAAVGILAITPDQQIVLIEQFRIPVGRRVVEIPAGLVGDEEEFRGESLAGTARRELLEETGWHAETVEPLIISPTSAGMTSEMTHLFLASGLERRGEGGGTGREQIIVHHIPITDVRSWLRQRAAEGLAIDFKIHAALFAAEIG